MTAYLGHMALRPPDHSWPGYNQAHAELLDFLDDLGNNGWARNPQTEEIMPNLMGDIHKAGLSVDRVKDAMASIGYDRTALHELDRWESKRTTGKFGR